MRKSYDLQCLLNGELSGDEKLLQAYGTRFASRCYIRRSGVIIMPLVM